MIAFDTNLLVRYLAEDDPEQSAAVDSAIKTALATNQPVLITQIVLCELIWVLSRTYGFRKEHVIPVLDQLIRSVPFQVEELDQVTRALYAYEIGRGDFSDYLIAERAAAAGCKRILTFDGELWSDPRFLRPERWTGR